MFYKLRHKPTGLFYKPSKHNSKSNVSRTGKVYQTRPSMAWLGAILYWPKGENLTCRSWEVDPRPAVVEEWEIVEIPAGGEGE